MQRFTLPRSGAAPLEFDGAIVALCSGRVPGAAEPARWHDLTIYRTSDEGWVGQLHYRTQAPGEREYAAAVSVATLEEIRRFFRYRNAFEYVDLDIRRLTERVAILEELQTRYRALVDKLLANLVYARGSPELSK